MAHDLTRRFAVCRLGIAALAACAFAPAALHVRATPETRAASAHATLSSDAASRVPLHLVAEHRYRIVGRVRFVFFWNTNDDVGRARLTWNAGDNTRAIALLFGSDPDRAPRRINEWGYVREEVRSNTADVFAIRSLTESDIEPTDEALQQHPRFSAMCSSLRDAEVESLVTRVPVDNDMTYHAFDRLLDRVVASDRWETKRTPTPVDALPGFLTALDRLIQTSLRPEAARLSGGKGLPPVGYVYNNRLYDLQLTRFQTTGRTTVKTQAFERLIRGDFAVHNRTTGEVTKFAVTYPPDGAMASVPVQIIYQPNWWLAVELQLDDTVDTPADPASDTAMLMRIRELCASTAPKLSNRNQP